MKIRRSAVLTIVLVFSLLGCTYQAEKRPVFNDDEVWICEKPYIELYWSKTDGKSGTIEINNVYTDIYQVSTHGALMEIYSIEEKEIHNTAESNGQYLLFKSRANYNYDTFTLQVEEDPANMFDGELPLLKFKCYKKSEYFKDKQDDK